MQDLQALIAGLPSGPKLISALEPVKDGEIPKLVCDVLNEYKSGNGAVASAPRLSLDDAKSVIKALSFVTPRGKHDLAFFGEQMLIKTAKNDVVVPYSAIKNLVIFDAIPKDTKGKVLIYLHLDPKTKILNGKQPLTAVVIQLSATMQLSMNNPKNPDQKLEGLAAIVMFQAFGAIGLQPSSFSAPDRNMFESSDRAVGVEAFVKARQGYLFPLPSGLCFLESPAMFIPIADIKSVELARATGASSTFDFYIHCKEGNTVEFSNLSRNEIATIQEYIRKAKFAQGPAESSSDDESGDEKGQVGGEDSDSDDPEDEDFQPSSDSEDERPSKKRKKAEKQTTKGTDKQGDDKDEEEEEADSSSSDDEDSDEDESSSDDSDGSVEMVSEDEFSMGQLQNMIKSEKEGGTTDDKQVE